MPELFRDIDDLGFGPSKKMPKGPGKFITGCPERDEPDQEEKPEPLVRLLSAAWKPGPRGFQYNEQCFLEVRAQYLKKTVRSRIRGKLYGIYNGIEEDLFQEVEGFIQKDGTALLEIKKLWFINDDHYSAWKKDKTTPAKYLIKEIAHSRGENVITSPELEMPVEEKLNVDFLEITSPHFNHNCALPCLDEKNSLIAAITRAFFYAKDNTDRELIITGHTAPGGDSEYNFSLSRRRGQAVKALLDGNSDLWKTVVDSDNTDQKIESEDYRQMLKSLAVRYDWPCNPEDVNDSSQSGQAVKGFQQEYNIRFSENAQLTVDGKFGPNTWQAVFFVLRDLIEKSFKSAGFDPAAKLTYGYVDGEGVYPCGECCPKTESGKSQEDGRVELVFYKKGECTPLISPAADRKIDSGKDPVTEKVWEKSPISVEDKDKDKELKIRSCDTHFAPGAEKLAIEYDVKGFDTSEVFMEVSSDAYENNPVYRRALEASELADGTHTFEWDGKANCSEGMLKERYVNPLFGPYKCKLYFNDEISDELEFNVFYHSVSLELGSYTSDGKEPDKSTDLLKWVQFKLNELGYFAGPVDGVKSDQTERAIRRYTYVISGMSETDDETNAQFLKHLEMGDGKREWLEGGRLPLENENIRIFLDHNYHYEIMPEFVAPNGAGDKDKEKLDRIELPLVASVLLVSKADEDGSGEGIDSPEAVGPVEIEWMIKDPKEDTSVIPLPSNRNPERPGPARSYVEKALKAKGQISGNDGNAQDNCPEFNNGFRGTNKDYWVSGGLLPPFSSRIDGDKVFTKVHTDSDIDGDQIGRAGIICRTSYIAGDNYSISARLSFQACSNNDSLVSNHEKFCKKTVSEALSFTTGQMTVWRRHKAGTVVLWPDTKRDINWEEVQEAYRAAHIELDVKPKAFSIDTLWNDADKKKYEQISKGFHTKWNADEMNNAKFNKNCMYSTALPEQGSMDPKKYKKEIMRRLNYFLTPENKIAFIMRTAMLVRDAVNRTENHGSIILHTDWIETVKVKHKILSIPYTKEFNPKFVCLGLNRGVAIIDNQMHKLQDRFLIAHELGHCHFLQHHQTQNGVSDNPNQHDLDDNNCIMCYPQGITSRKDLTWDKNEETEATFCGKCLLKLRGWAVAKGDLPLSS